MSIKRFFNLICEPFAGSGQERDAERGNIFFTLFGAVAIVGLLGAGIMSTMRGPLSSMVEVNRRTQAEAEMSVGAKLALLEAANRGAGADCDSDTFTEPLEYASPGAADAPTNGGFIPASVGAAKTDPWGTAYGYCAWDPGSITGDANCNDGSGSRLTGTQQDTGPDAQNYPVVAIISAGPNKQFETTCVDGTANPSVNRSGDDLVSTYNYAEAENASGGLWSLKDSATVEIAKDLEVTGGAVFTDPLNLTGASAQLQLGASSVLLPTQADLATCNAANDQLLRLRSDTSPYRIEICDDGIGWVTATGAWSFDGVDLFFTNNVGIGNVDPQYALDVTGTLNAGATTLASASVTGTLSSGGLATLASASVTGTLSSGGLATLASASVTGTLSSGGLATLDSLSVTNNAAVTLDLDVDGDTTLDQTDIDGPLTVANGLTTLETLNATNTAITGTLDVTGNIDGNGTLDILSNSNLQGTLTVGGATTLNSTLDVADNVDLVNDKNITWGTNTAITGNDTTFTVDISGTDELILNASGVTIGGDVVASGDLQSGGTVYIDDTSDLRPLSCTAATQKLRWTGTAWQCVSVGSSGSGGTGGTMGISDVLQNGNDAAGENLVDIGYLVIGANTTSTGDQTLELDVTGDVGATNYCDADGNNCFVSSKVSNSDAGRFQLTGSVVNNRGAVATEDFVFGSPQLADDADVTHDARFFFDKSKGAFRTGAATGTHWDDTSVGAYSFATGHDTEASGANATAMGQYVIAGDGLAGSGNGDYSFAIGLLDGTQAVNPTITGDRSMGIFMGSGANAQSSVSITASDTFALLGGKMVIDPNSPATQTSASGSLTLDVTGDIGANNYCDAAGANCFAATDVANMDSIFDADNDTGIQVEEGADDDTIRFDTTGVERAVITPTGELGVGTASPSSFVEFEKDQNALTGLQLDNNTAGTAGGTQVLLSSDDSDGALSALSSSYTTAGALVADGVTLESASTAAAGLNLSAAGANPVGVWTNGTQRIAVTSTGTVGIGDLTPDTGGVQDLELDVAGDVGAANYCDEAGNNCITPGSVEAAKLIDADGDTQIQVEEGADDDTIRFDTAGTERAVILPTGEVGIGTASPTAQLEIAYSTPDATISKSGIFVNRSTATAGNVTSYDKAGHFALLLYDIPNGVTDSGYKVGVDGSAYANTTDFAGTLAQNYGVWARAGIYSAAATATINNVYAVYADVLNNVAGTTIDNAYGVYIENDEAVGTITNRWGLYQADSIAKNYFAGAVGIGDLTPDTGDQALELDVAGDVGADNYCDGSGNNCITPGSVEAAKLIDTDGDTQIQVEEGADDDTIRFDTLGAERMVILPTGEVGIGTNTPVKDFEIQDAGDHVTMGLFSDLDKQAGINLGHANDDRWALLAVESTDATIPRALQLYESHAAVGGSDGIRVTFEAGGDVGIGTTTPDTTLHVAGKIKSNNSFTSPMGALVYDDTTGSLFLGTQDGASTSGAAIALSGATNTEFASGAGGITFLTSGASPAAVIDSSGDVGIGDASPDGTLKLDVEGQVGATDYCDENGANCFTSTDVTAMDSLFDADNDTGIQVEEGADDDTIRFDTAGTERMVIGPTGEVGIGIGAQSNIPLSVQNAVVSQTQIADFSRTEDSELAALHIYGYTPTATANAYMDSTVMLYLPSGFESKNLQIAASDPAGAIRFHTAGWNSNATERMIIDASGNVGIGTTSPLYGLDVRNSTNASQIHVSGTGNDEGGYILGYAESGLYGGGGAYYDGTNWIAKHTSATISTQLGDAFGWYADSGLTVGNTYTPTQVALLDGNGSLTLKASAGASTTHELLYNENGGEIRLYDELGAIGGFIDYVGSTTDSFRVLQQNTAGNLELGLATTNTTGNIVFMKAGYAEAARIDANGDMGIGDTTPDGTLKLDVEGQVGATGYCDANGANCFVSTDVTAMAIDDLTDAQQDNSSLFMGTGAGAVDDGDNYNIGVGRSVLAANTSGAGNVAMGWEALKSNTTAGENTGIGNEALRVNTTGAGNSALGSRALNLNTIGGSNTAVGFYALSNNKAKGQNTAVGYRALDRADNTTSASDSWNTAIGSYALYGSATPANNTGTNNVALGGQALYGNTSGANNTAVGYQALYANTTGTDNVAIGTQAGDINTTGSRNILIGSGVDAPTATTSDHLNIGNTIYADLSADKVIIGADTTTNYYGLDADFDVVSPSTHVLIGLNAGAADKTASVGFAAADTVKWLLASRGDNDAPIVADRFAIYNGSSVEVMTIEQAGNVGIGTNDPETLLEVGDGTGDTRITSNSSGTYGFRAENAANSAFHFGVTAGTANAVFSNNAGTELMRIEDGGNIGIGVAAPSARLDVVGDGTNFAGRLQNTSGGDGLRIDTADATANNALLWFQGADAMLNVYSDASNNTFLRLQSAGTANVELSSTGVSYFNGGNVGIGDATPDGTLKLDVEGQIGATAYCDENGAGCTTITDARDSIIDADSDTQIQVEEGADDDTIRFDTAGVERMTIGATGAVNIATNGSQLLTVQGVGATIVSKEYNVADANYMEYRNSAGTRRAYFGYGSGGSDVFSLNNETGGAIQLTGGGVSSILSDSNTTITNGYSNLALKNTDATAGNFSRIYYTPNNGAAAAITGAKINDHTNAYGDYQIWTRGSTGNGVRLHVDQEGQVGIGTTSPAAKLEVSTLTGTTGLTVLGSDSNGFADAEIKSTGTAGISRLYFSDTAAQNGLIRYTHSSDSMEFYTNASERMRIDNAGNVGIGATSPSGKLNIVKDGAYNSEGNSAIRIFDVASSPTVGLQMGADATNNIGWIQAMHPVTSWTTRPLVLQGNGGNVGIGTTNPTAKLEVSGTGNGIRISNAAFTERALLWNSAGDNAYLLLKDTADANKVYLNTAGGSYLVGGDVGIGTTSPTNKFDITTGSTLSSGIHFGEFANEGGYMTSLTDSSLYLQGGTEYVSGSWTARSTGASMVILESGDTSFYNNSGLTDGNTYTPTEIMRIASSGNVGMGISTPSARLHLYNSTDTETAMLAQNANTSAFFGVNKAASANRFIGSTNEYAFVGTTTGNGLEFATNNTVRAVIDSSGNIGVGHTGPSYPIHVQSTEYGIVTENTSAADGQTARVMARTGAAQGQIEIDFYNDAARTGGGYGVIQTGKTGNTPDFAILSGNVGVGITDPAVKFEIDDTAYSYLNSVYLGRVSAGHSGGGYGEIGYNLGFESTTGNYSYRYSDTAAAIMFGVYGGGIDFKTAPSGTAGNAMTLTSRMFLSEAGSLGIGTISPDTTLHVAGKIKSTNSFVASMGALVYENTTGSLYLGTQDGSSASGAAIALSGASNSDFASGAGGITFLTSSASPAAVIASNGNVGIGTSGPSVELDVIGDIEYTGTITDVSDRRLKTDIVALDTAAMMEKLMQVDTYSFRMKDDKKARQEYGVMAQELEELFPTLVHTAKDEMGTKSVNYVGLIAPLIETTKALHAENQDLRADLAELRADVNGLKAHTGYGMSKGALGLGVLLGMLAMAGLGGGAAFVAGRGRRL